MQFNMLIAMMTRTYELIYRTQKEYKRQWAQVILMLELSLPPKDRLMALLKYSRPIGTDKRKRAFVVTRKTDLQTLTESEKMMREQQINAIKEEKRMLLKRRLKVSCYNNLIIRLIINITGHAHSERRQQKCLPSWNPFREYGDSFASIKVEERILKITVSIFISVKYFVNKAEIFGKDEIFKNCTTRIFEAKVKSDFEVETACTIWD